MARLTKEQMEARALEAADMILGGMLLKEIAQHYGYTDASQVRYLIENHLFFINRDKYDAVKEKLNNNLSENARKTVAKNKDKIKGPRQETIDKVIRIADYIIDNDCTLADAERALALPLNTASGYINKYLPQYDSKKYKAVRNIVDSHKKPTGSRPAPKLPQDIELIFVEGGDVEHNCHAICDYIVRHNASKQQVANNFNISEVSVMAHVKAMNDIDKHKHVAALRIVLRGNYTGSQNYIQKPKTNTEWLNNSHMVCDYLIANNATTSEAKQFFSIPSSTVRKEIENMAEIDYEKYVATKNVQSKNGTKSNVKIAPNPKLQQEQPKDFVNTTTNAVITPLSPTLVAEPVKIAASAEPVVQKISTTKIEMVAEPPVETSTQEVKVGFFQRIKNWFIGA